MAKSILHNSITLIGGRVFLSIGRFFCALIITHSLGAEVYGAYALITSLIFLFDWFADFGQTDITVREISRDTIVGHGAMKSLIRNKVIMGLVAFLLFTPVLFSIRPDNELIAGGLMGAGAILLGAALQPAKAVLKSAMRQDLDIAAEVAGLVVMLTGLIVAVYLDAGLVILVGTFVLGRLVHFALLFGLQRKYFPFSTKAPAFGGLKLAQEASPIGVAGLFGVLYEGLAPILIARFFSLEAVAVYAIAARFVMPVSLVLLAINNAFFPVLAQLWNSSTQKFIEVQQSALFLSSCLAALMVSALIAGAPWLMGLMGEEFRDSHLVLRMLALVAPFRAISVLMSPVVVISGRQRQALAIAGGAICVQIVLQLFLVPRFGAEGAAAAYLLTEPIMGVLAIPLLITFIVGVKLDWAPIYAILTTTAAALAMTMLAENHIGSFAAMLLAPSLVAGALLVLRIVTVGKTARMLALIADRQAPRAL